MTTPSSLARAWPAALLGLLLLACTSARPAPQPASPETPSADDPAPSPDERPDPAGAGPESIVIARLDGEPLTLDEALNAFVSVHTGHGALVQGTAELRELATRLIEQRVFLAEAQALGVDQDVEVLEATETYAYKKAAIVFWRRTVDERVEVPEEDIEEFYERTGEALSVAVLETGGRDEAQALRARVVAGEELTELAEAHSIHPSRDFGGVMPFVLRGDLDPALEDAVFAAEEPGTLTEVVETEQGFAFARLDARTINEQRPPRDVVLPQIRGILEGRLEDELRSEAEARVREEADVLVDESLLAQEALVGDADPGGLVARSAGERLTLGELRELLDLDAVAAAPAEDVRLAAGDLVEEWVWERAVGQAVDRLGLREDPEVAREVEAFRRGAILRTLYTRYVYADLSVTEDDVRAFYDERVEAEFTRPPEVRLAYIVVETEQEAAELLDLLEAGGNFSVLARERSIDPTSALHGGRIGWIRPGSILLAIEEEAFALEPGGVAGPIATDEGQFLIQVLDRKESEVVPYRQSRGAAERRLMTELQRDVYAEWARRLRERADVVFLDEGMREAEAWLESRKAAEAPATEEGGSPMNPPPGMAPPPGHAEGSP